MRIFDTHTHIGLIHEDPIEQLIVSQEARQAEVVNLISICNNLIDFFQVHSNLSSAGHVYHAAGVSPSEVQFPGKDWENKLMEALKKERVIAVGETGLDYYKKFGNKNDQIELFIRQLEIASHADLPVIIHNRQAGEDLLGILQQKLPNKGGVLHCYSEDWEFARKALELNLFISFAGNVTYRNARTLQETAKNMPLERMVVESEAPFLTPAEFQKKRNSPTYLPSTVRFIAELREEPLEEVAETLYQNSLRLFGLDG